MKILRVLISAILLFSLYSCMGDPFSPEEDSSSPVKALAYKENNSVMKYDVGTGTATTLFTPDTEEEIGGVAVDKSGNLYVSLYQSFATGNNDTYKNRVLRFTSAGMQSVVFQDSAITSLKITHMFTSPSGRYLLIYRYQYGDFELVCIDTEVKENNVFNSIFNRGRPVDYLDFTRLVWDEKNYRFYVMNDRNNVPKVAEFDLITGVYDKKDDPYIQLYVDSETLKSQGIIQEEFDFNKYTGDDFSVPKQLKFHPGLNAFIYMEGRELKCYNLDKGIFSTIMSSPAAQLPTYFFEDIEIIWDIDISPRDVSADLNQAYQYYIITDSVLATKQALNSNIEYNKIGTYSLPLLVVRWTDYNPIHYGQFLIRGELLDSKFHAAESYFIYYTLRTNFFSYIGNGLNDIRYSFTTLDNAITEYENWMIERETMYNKIKNSATTDYFKTVINDLIEETDKFLDLEMATLEFMKDQDRDKLIATTLSLFPDVSHEDVVPLLEDIFVDDLKMINELRGLISNMRYRKSSYIDVISEDAVELLEDYNVFLK